MTMQGVEGKLLKVTIVSGISAGGLERDINERLKTDLKNKNIMGIEIQSFNTITGPSTVKNEYVALIVHTT
jgi:hypothetical protein